MFTKQLNKLQALLPLVEAVNESEIITITKFLLNRIKNPDSYVVMLGETSSGKSSIINGLIGETLLPVSSIPTTGTIVEIEFTQEAGNRCYYINREANIVTIDSIDSFQQLAWKPSSDVLRLLLRTSARQNAFKGMRLFDTPGYDAIKSDHEEVLFDFMPNSDVVIYTINYNEEFGVKDAQMLRSVRELVRDDVEFILVVNRCKPGVDQNDNCVRKCRGYINDIIGKDPKTFIIFKQVLGSGERYATVHCPALWKYVGDLISSPARIDLLKNAFDGFIEDLYYVCDEIIQARLRTVNISKEKYLKLLELQESYAKGLLSAIDTKITPTYEYIKSQIPRRLGIVKDNIATRVKSEIDNSPRSDMLEMRGFITGHVLPFTIQQECKEIQNFISVQVNALNDELDDLIQNELIQFNNKVNIVLTTNIEKAGKGIIGGAARKAMVGGLGRYFAKYGGRGGANAGIANAASHALKVFGRVTKLGPFKRETHIGLQKLLSKVGATSMKAVSAAIAVLIEVAWLGVDYMRWKIKLRNKVDSAISAWQKEAEMMVLKDIEKSRIENVRAFEDVVDKLNNAFEIEQPVDSIKCENDAQLSRDIAKVLGIDSLI